MSSDPFIGEIDIMAFNFPPRGWALCNGQLLNIQPEPGAVLRSSGRTSAATAARPTPCPTCGAGCRSTRARRSGSGAGSGSAGVTLTRDQLPPHNHAALASSQNASSAFAPNNSLAVANNLYRKPETLTIVNPGTVAIAGGGQAHENMSPYAVLSFCIALQGTFPSRN